MSDKNPTIQCPSCGHTNALYVDKCIICDFSLVLYRKQLTARNTPEARALENDISVGHSGKRLGPLPDSDYLVDKHKSKGDTGKILQCGECGEPNRIGAFMCVNCGARLTEDNIIISPSESPVEMHIVEDDTTDAEVVDSHLETTTQSVENHIEAVRQQVMIAPTSSYSTGIR